MLPLAISAMPSVMPPAPSTSSSSGSAPFSVQTDIAALARQQLPIAVSSTGAPAAFSPDTMQSRQAQSERRNTAITQPPVQAVEDGSDHAPTQQTQNAAAHADAPEIRFFNLQPNRLGLSFSSQFAAQYIAQDSRPVTQQEWKHTLPPNKPGVGRAHGAAAYGIAVARNQPVNANADTTL